jgi:hypothetical protein
VDRISTIVVKLECREQKPLADASNVEVIYDTSTGTATRAAHYGLLLAGLRLSYTQAR